MRLENGCTESAELTIEEMPEIDLYMDQVIQVFEKKYADNKRYPEEKVLTKTMINNYAKGRLLPAIHKKRYSRKHLVFISLIYQLKGTLSIPDIKKMLDVLQDEMEDETFSLEQFYTEFIGQVAENKKHLIEWMKDLEKKAESLDEASGKVMLAARLSNLSCLYKQMAEQIIDGLEVPE